MIKPDYPSVLLIYTGGTIGMIENPETGVLESFNFQHLKDNMPELKTDCAEDIKNNLLLLLYNHPN